MPITKEPEIYKELASGNIDYNKTIGYVDMNIIDIINTLGGSLYGFIAFKPTVIIDNQEFNTNNFVKVKLTEHGIKMLEERHKTHQKELCRINNLMKQDFVMPKKDENGYTKYQFWLLLNAFSPVKDSLYECYDHFVTKDAPPVFEEIIIDEKDLSPHIDEEDLDLEQQ